MSNANEDGLLETLDILRDAALTRQIASALDEEALTTAEVLADLPDSRRYR